VFHVGTVPDVCSIRYEVNSFLIIPMPTSCFLYFGMPRWPSKDNALVKFRLIQSDTSRTRWVPRCGSGSAF